MVFVLDKTKTPLAPTTKAKARILLKKGKAVVHKIFPFTIRLKEKKVCTKSFEIKFDVGASVTGVAIVDALKCFFFAEILHRGKAVKKAMDSRRAIRRGRRNRKTRYREARFDNRVRPDGWLPRARTYTIKELAKYFEVTTGEGWETYFNRKEVALPKEHYYDAMCIGDNYKYKIVTNSVLEVKAQGRGSRQMCRMDRFGFPRTKAKGSKIVKGFQTGDIVKAIVTKGKKIGTYLGKVAVRVSGNFNITTNTGTIQGINHKYCKTIQKGDGYAYSIANIKQ